MYGSSVCSDAAGMYLVYSGVAVGQIAVLTVHRHIAVKRDAVQRVQVRQVHRRAACGNKRFDAVFCAAAASASTVEAGRCLASKGSSVPSMSKNRSLDIRHGVTPSSDCGPSAPSGRCGLRACRRGWPPPQPARWAFRLCTFSARWQAADSALMPSTTWPTSVLASSTDLPRPISIPACRLRLCILVQVTIRSPMPDRPANVSGFPDHGDARTGKARRCRG